MSTSTRDSYHHGDLRAACLDAAMELLGEEDETALSLRGVARRAGVSANAPYRHYRDKEALLAALATRGFQDLTARLVTADSSAVPGAEFIALAQAYVNYAVEHPALFRLMFGHPCSRSHPDAAAAAGQASAVLAARVATAILPAHRDAFMIGCWALVHGLAALILDGKLTASDPGKVSELVRVTVATMLAGDR